MQRVYLLQGTLEGGAAGLDPSLDPRDQALDHHVFLLPTSSLYSQGAHGYPFHWILLHLSHLPSSFDSHVNKAIARGGEAGATHLVWPRRDGQVREW